MDRRCYIFIAGMCKYAKKAQNDTCHCEIISRHLHTIFPSPEENAKTKPRRMGCRERYERFSCVEDSTKVWDDDFEF